MIWRRRVPWRWSNAWSILIPVWQQIPDLRSTGDSKRYAGYDPETGGSLSNSNVRFNVECDDSITKLYETLPQSVWEKDYDFASFTQLPDLNCVGFTVPLTDAQRFGIHERIRDELAKLPYYSVSLGKDTLTARDLQTKEIHYMSTLFHIVF